ALVLPLVQVDGGRAFAAVVAAVLPGERVDRIRPELSLLRRLDDRRADRTLDAQLADADGRRHLERRPAGVLADRPFVLGRGVDVGGDDRQRLAAAVRRV